MNKVDDDVDEFLAAIEGEAGASMRAVDARIRAALPDLSRVLWRGVFWGGTEQAIIGYGDLLQPRPKGQAVEWFLIGLAQQKRHISLYVNAADAAGYLGAQYAAELGTVTIGAASIGFRSASDLDLDALERMVIRARELSGL
ncbi:hypothetical protein EV379_2738 [Microterricola gilva]|uniref:YdhG-like domain-containing protein n=1 Tax=Microterricola gilva TaxID=393267 RepID=A0A4Q8ANY6_9MICO|nr:DUF1801 domain-containing protein [Microterricola gilva]RZU66382.1 hypothetical protein EV379_2738 [Microterricola gilva]